MDQILTSDFATFPRICVGQNQSAPILPAGFDQLASEFEAATGWVLRFDENLSSRQRRENASSAPIPVGKISICDMSAEWPAGKNTASRQVCDQLAERISQVFDDLQNSMLKLSQGVSTELPSGLESLPIASAEATTSREANLADLVQGLLASCIQLANADAAAVCLIDDESKSLTAQYTHSSTQCQGLVRTLSNCPADLEALCGSAVVMSNSESVQTWQCPIECKSAVCLPISSSSTLLGTLWVFGSEERDFDDKVVNILEIISGRIAAELELVVTCRDLIAQEAATSVSTDSEVSNGQIAKIDTDVALGISSYSCGEVIVQPPFDGWALKQLSGASLTEWSVSCDELIVALVASGIDTQQRIAIESALKSATAKPGCDPSELLDSIRVLCGCDDDASNAVSCVAAVIDPLIGEVQLAQIGSCSQAALSRCDGELQTIYRNHACFMTRGQSLSLSCDSGENSQLVFTRSK